MPYVLLNRVLVPNDDPRLPPWEDGVCLAEGVYTTWRWDVPVGGNDAEISDHGHNDVYEMHAARLAAQGRASGLRYEPSSVPSAQDLIGLALANDLGGITAKFRMAIVKNDSKTKAASDVIGFAEPINQADLDARRERGLRVWSRFDGRGAGDIQWHQKRLGVRAILEARRETAAKGLDEVLMLSNAGEVCEASWSNVFLVVTGSASPNSRRLVTPALSSPCLPGMARMRVIEVARRNGIGCEERLVRVEDALAAEEVFLTSSISEVMPVVELDGMPVGSGRPGPFSSWLQNESRMS